MNALATQGVGFRSLTEAIDTATPGGKLVFHSFGALAELERDLIRERTKAGLAAARARGRMAGRPRALSDTQLEMARVLLADPLRPIDEVCGALHLAGDPVPPRARARPARPRPAARAGGATTAAGIALGVAVLIARVLTRGAVDLQAIGFRDGPRSS